MVGIATSIYRVDEYLGMGTLGAAYRATSISGGDAGKTLCVKMLKCKGASESTKKALDKEINALKHILPHDNIITILKGAVTYEGHVLSGMVVMDLIDGADMSNLFTAAQAGFMVTGARDLAIGVLRALHHLHNSEPRVIHRDLKPENVMLEAGTRRPIVIDFGGSAAVEGMASSDGCESKTRALYGCHVQIEYMPTSWACDEVMCNANVWDFSQLRWRRVGSTLGTTFHRSAWDS